MFLDCASNVLMVPPTAFIKLWLFVQIMVKFYLKAFWQDFEYGKMQKFGFCLQDL